MAAPLLIRGISAAALAMALAAGPAIANPDYWLVGHSTKRFVYIDINRITRPQAGIVYAWVEIVNERESPIPKESEKSALQWEEFSCNTSQTSLISFASYNRDGEVIDSATPSTPTWDLIVPESLGDAEGKFLCADPSSWTSTLDWYETGGHFHLGDGDPVADADHWNRLFRPAQSRGRARRKR